jgi:hypothetical protein
MYASSTIIIIMPRSNEANVWGSAYEVHFAGQDHLTLVRLSRGMPPCTGDDDPGRERERW